MNDLSFKVLSLKPSSTKKRFFQVIFENGSELNFHENSIIRYHIKENEFIENKILYQALDHTEREQIKSKIIVLLSYRQRSKKELKDTFLQKGYHIKNILSVINELEERKYLNDAKFTKMLASYLIKDKKLGRYLVEQKLFQHEIDSSVMEPIISNLYNKYPPSNTIKKILNKKKISQGNHLKNKIKIINHLKRKGFSYNEINSTLESHYA